MKRFVLLAFLAGLTLFGVLVAWSGLDDVAGAAASAGWATLVVILARAVVLAWAGIAWNVLFPPGAGTSMPVAVLIRFVREGINQLLPVGQVGGDIAGARLATFWGRDGTLAGAVTIADVALQALTQLLFAVAGVVVLVLLQGDGALVRYAAGGLVVATLGIGAFFVVQGRAGSRLMDGLVRRVAGSRADALSAAIDRLWGQLAAVYATPGRVLISGAMHLLGWVVATVEVYVVLHAMGFPVTWAEAFVIESLGQAVRGAAFAVPGGLGVQEGGFIALCGLFGIPPGPALALSLVKRVPDFVLGLPALAAWQVLEGRRALRPPEPAGTTSRDGTTVAGTR